MGLVESVPEARNQDLLPAMPDQIRDIPRAIKALIINGMAVVHKIGKPVNVKICEDLADHEEVLKP